MCTPTESSSRLITRQQHFCDYFHQLYDVYPARKRWPYSRMSRDVLVFELESRESGKHALLYLNKNAFQCISRLLLALVKVPKFLNPVRLHFMSISKTNPYSGIVTKLFQQRITDIYGDQSLPLSRIFDNGDRACELLFDEERPVGCIVYKLRPTNEFALEGIHNSLEIKTLVVLNFQTQSRKGYGYFLESRIAEKAKCVGARGIHVMVANWCPDSLNFFKKRCYGIIRAFGSKYQNNMLEFLHYKAL